MKTFIISAYDMVTGFQFGEQIDAPNVDTMFRIFYEMYPNGDLADYWEYTKEAE